MKQARLAALQGERGGEVQVRAIKERSRELIEQTLGLLMVFPGHGLRGCNGGPVTVVER